MTLAIDRALVQKRFFEFMDHILLDELESFISEMIRRSPRLLCRLNFKNSKVAEIVRAKMNAGLISPFDLMYDPAETFSTKKADDPSMTMDDVTEEDRLWLESLERKWLRISQESGMGLVLA